MILFEEKKCCSGCSACKVSCPKGAIEMIADEEGFLYPNIDSDKCIDCSICKKVCPFIKKRFEDYKLDLAQEVYACKHINDSVKEKSTSGGVFTALSDLIFSENGIVYGASYDENFKVLHKRTENKKARDYLRGSKYSQSDLKNVFLDVKKDLKNGKKVLFTGTPCQIMGLKLFLNKLSESNNFIACDFVCHGVPSPVIFEEHIKLLSRDKKILWYECRAKDKGWHAHTEKVTYVDKTVDYKSRLSQSYKYLFASHMILRESCHNCGFANIKRISDITIGDFWGIEKVMPKFDDEKGVSLVLINSTKGKKIFEEIKNKLIIEKSDAQSCLQPQLKYPTPVSKKRDQFWNDYRQYGYAYILKKYSNLNFKFLIVDLMRKIYKSMKKLKKQLSKVGD